MTVKSIKHMVIFTLKYEKGSTNERQFLKEGKNILSAIPMVNNFKVLKQISNKNDFDFGFSMEFANQDDYDKYNNHPEHVSFVEERWEEEVDKFLEIDFEKIKLNNK